MPDRKSPAKTGGPAYTPFFIELTKRGEPIEFAADAVIIEERTHGDSFYLIQEGRVRVYSTGEDGSQVTIDEQGPGDYVGEMALESHLRSASVVAITPVMATVVKRDAVLNAIRSRPEHALELIFELVRRARATTDTVKGMALLDVYQRISRLIEGLVGHPVVPAVVPGAPTDAEIAQRVGSSEHVVTFILEDLIADGYLERQPNSLVVRRRLPAHWGHTH